MKHVRTIAMMAAVCMMSAGWVRAEANEQPSAVLPALTGAAKFSKAQFDALLSKMDVLAELIEDREPASAKAIRAAVAKARRESISENMGDVVDLLAKSLQGAYVKEGAVAQALDDVLAILRGEREPRTKDIDLIKKWIKEIRDLAGKESDLIRHGDTPLGQRQDKQDKITKGAEDIVKQMKENGEKGQPSPGLKPMEDAKANSGEAAKSLGDKPADAGKKQEATLENLRKAEGALLAALGEIQGDVVEDTLERIDEILSKALEQQKVLSAGTRTTYAKRPDGGDYARKEVLELTGLSGGEGKIRGEIERVRDLLRSDDTPTLTFPVILEQVSDNLLDVQKRLAAKDAGALTQATQKEIEEDLQSLINAVRKGLAEHRDKTKTPPPPPPPPNQPPPPPPPLVSRVEELRLLYVMEVQIATATKSLDKMAADGKLPAETVNAQHRKLSDRQRKVKDMTDALIRAR